MADNTPKPAELYEAALQGDVSRLQDVLLRDPNLLHRPLPPSSKASPLHVACKLGHTIFVLELLHRNPNLAEEFDPNDKSSLLHLAVRNGHLELVRSLVSINPGMCYVRDMHGRTPVHVAAIKGQVDVLEELLRSTPAAARERVGSSLETVMHLCVKFNQLEALMRTVRMVGDAQMLNATDFEGNTILHVAVANKQLEIVDFLLNTGRIKKNTKNSNGSTAMDVLIESPNPFNSTADDRLRSTLQREKVLSSKALNKKERKKQSRSDWFEKPMKQRNTFMIVASLIATMAFQAGVNPPGGVWQDTVLPAQSSAPAAAAGLESEDDKVHDAGSSILAQEHPTIYTIFLVLNMVGFMLSMVIILLLISGLPCRRLSMFFIKTKLWIAISATAFSYLLAAWVLIPNDQYNKTQDRVIKISIFVWFGVMGLILIGNIIRYTVRFIKYLCKCFLPKPQTSKSIA